jgi:hypothetical protein
VPAGLAFLLFHPRLWLPAALPTIVGTGAIAAGLLLGTYISPFVNQQFLPHQALGAGLDLVVGIGLFLACLATGLGLGLAMAFLLSAPLLALLSARVETAEGPGTPPDRHRGFASVFLGSLYALVLVPWAGLLSLIPLVGPPLGWALMAYAVAFEGTSPALARRGKDLTAQRLWHRQFRAETLGFGAAGAVLLAVPGANLLAVPTLVVGGTRLVRELGEPPAGEVTSPAGSEGLDRRL